MGHAVDTADQSLSESMSMSPFFQNKGRQELCFQLREMVISVVSLLIANSYYHKFKLIDLADWLLNLLRGLLVLYLVACLVVRLIRLRSELGIRLHLLGFYHSIDMSRKCVLFNLIY